jgi:ATP-dependent helicase/nuclease subunit A
LRVLRPSDPGDDEPHRSAPPGDRDRAMLRGTVLHRLMQSLPDIAPERRVEATRRYLARAGKKLDDAARDAIAAQVLALLDDTRFAPLFAPGSRAEVSISGKLAGRDGNALLVAGQIDRIAITGSDVLIADYKTNRPPPARIDDVPPGYVRQLALYRAVLQKIYPEKAVRAALLWTETPDLMELSSETLNRALADRIRVTLP